MIKEDTKFKPTLKEPMSDQSQKFEKNFDKTMKKHSVKLVETDALLTEKEQSLKKKIFDLSKMEALVFSDPKLTSVYDEMAENGEEKYGYHYNETIMNMIFNDYVLNSPKYLQKYKMAIPKEKKRRDKSGINQLKKAGEEKMSQTGLPKQPKKPEKELSPSGLPKDEVDENAELVTKVQFLVNEKDPENPDVFAYFPEENYDNAGKFKTGYSHIGQHSAVHPQYAAESRPATPEEYADLKAELEGVGYNLEVLENGINETTSAGSAGGAAGYVGYAGPAAWGSGDLMKTKGKSKAMRKPIWKMGTIVGESNYLTDPSGFEKYVEKLNEQSDIDFIQKNSEAFGSLDKMSPTDRKIIKKDIQTGKLDEMNNPDKISTVEELKAFLTSQGRKLSKEDIPNLAGEALYKVAVNTANKMLPMHWDDLPDINSMWDYIDENGGMTYEEFIQAVKDAVNDRISEEGFSLDDLMEKKNIKESTDNFEQVKAEAQRISREEGVAQHVNQVSDNVFKISDWYDADTTVISFENGRQLNEANVSEKATSKAQQRLFGMAHAVQKGELSPKKVGGAVKKIAKTVSPKDVEDFASTKHEDLPEKVDEYDKPEPMKGLPPQEHNPKKYPKMNENPLAKLAVPAAVGFGQAVGNKVADKVLNEFLSLHDAVEYVSDREGENPFELQGVKWQFVNAKYPNGKVDIGVYRFGHDVVYDYSRWREEMGINEDTQTMIQSNGTSMSNKSTPAGDQSSNVDMGMRPMSENKVFIKNDIVMNENEQKLLEELNNELNAFSIHHNKLKKMSEDRKPSALVLRDRLGNENEKNFKSDLQDSGTKEIIDVEKELQWKDQQTDVKNAQKLGQDIEKKEIKVTDAEGEEHLKNVGDSTNDKGDEIPKRNRTTEEQHEIDMYRNGQHSWVYDNEPDKRFEDRMKADMGEDIYKMRQEQLKFKGKAPMYNKDPQPVEDTTSDKVQFNKEQTGWNERMGLKEGVISAKYVDVLGKTKFVDFNLSDVLEVKELAEGAISLNLKGLGNVYSNKVQMNEGVSKAIEEWNFYLVEGKVVAHKPVQNLTESEQKTEKPAINEQFNKMKHLTGYRPNEFVDTKNVKKNRGF